MGLGSSKEAQSVALGPLGKSVGYALRRAQLAVFNDFIATLEHVDLRPGQYSVLTLVGLNPGIVQRRVCETLGIKTANFVPLFAELERRRLTKRVAIDRRSDGLYLSAKGRALVARAQTLCDIHERRVTDAVGLPQAKLLIALLGLVAELQKGGGTGGCAAGPSHCEGRLPSVTAPESEKQERHSS